MPSGCGTMSCAGVGGLNVQLPAGVRRVTVPSVPRPNAAEPSAEVRSKSFDAGSRVTSPRRRSIRTTAALRVYGEHGAGAVVQAEQARERGRLGARGPHERVDARESEGARGASAPWESENQLIRSVRAGGGSALSAFGARTTVRAVARCEYERQRQRRRSHEGETTRSERRIQRELPESFSSR